MNLSAVLKTCFGSKPEPEHLRRGKLGERAAKQYLQRQGLKFLVANFRSARGEIDLIFRTDDGFWSQVRKGHLASLLLLLAQRLVNLGVLPKRLITSDLYFTPNPTYCLVFVEVKTRSSEEWNRPAAAVDHERRGRLSRAALDYLRLLKNPAVKIRFDIVEVLLADGKVSEVRHLPNTFELARPLRYG